MQLLYEKYVEHCQSTGIRPQKLHLYKEVFNSEFNISFLKPKKDRCDMCEAAKVNGSKLSQEDVARHEKHRTNVRTAHAERTTDRDDKERCVVCFDMQNVFALPEANISNFFYKRKLNVFHLTAHCSITRQWISVARKCEWQVWQ